MSSRESSCVMAFSLGCEPFAAGRFGGLGTLLASGWLVLAPAGLALPNAPAPAMSRPGEAPGSAAALLGAVQAVAH
jgi:hypothetical protein